MSIVRQQASAASGWRGVMLSAALGTASVRPLASLGQAPPDQFPKTYAVASSCVQSHKLTKGDQSEGQTDIVSDCLHQKGANPIVPNVPIMFRRVSSLSA